MHNFDMFVTKVFLKYFGEGENQKQFLIISIIFFQFISEGTQILFTNFSKKYFIFWTVENVVFADGGKSNKWFGYGIFQIT